MDFFKKVQVAGRVSSKVTQKRLFSGFLVFLTTVGFLKRRDLFPETILPIKPRTHICPCSWAVGTFNKFWVQA